MIYSNFLDKKILDIFIFNIFKQIYTTYLHLFTNIYNTLYIEIVEVVVSSSVVSSSVVSSVVSSSVVSSSVVSSVVVSSVEVSSVEVSSSVVSSVVVSSVVVSSSVVSSVVSSVEVSSVEVSSSVVSSVAYMQRTPTRTHARLLSAAGGLACESKLQGEIDGYDCSNYQLFRCPSWDSFYRLVCNLKY